MQPEPTVRIPDLQALISEVIETVQPREREVRDEEGRWHELRVYPYRTSENRIEGAVIVLLDITRCLSREEMETLISRRAEAA